MSLRPLEGTAGLSRRIMEVFHNTGVLLEGHFRLTSGRHSPQFLQCSQVLRHPEHAAWLCGLMADPFRESGVETVLGPALGGIVLAYEVARSLGVQAAFTEKVEGRMTLRRGFHISPGERVLVVEDAVTTGGSVNSVMEILSARRAEVVGVSVMVDRSGGAADFGVPTRSLLSLNIPDYSPAECPLCREGIELVHPKALGL